LKIKNTDPIERLKGRVPQFMARLFTGMFGRFFLGLALLLVGHMVAEISESYKFIMKRKIELQRMNIKGDARVTNVFLNVVNDQIHWASNQDGLPGNPAFEILRELTLEVPGKAPFQRIFPSFQMVHPGEEVYQTFMDPDILRQGHNSFANYRWAKSERKEIPYYYPQRFAILITADLKKNLESLIDTHNSWWFKSSKKLNRFESLFFLMDQPIYQLAFLWTDPPQEVNKTEVYYEESHPEVFVPARTRDFVLRKSPIQLFYWFSPFIVFSAVISFFAFIFFYSISRTFTQTWVNNPAVVSIFLVSIPFWSSYYAAVDNVLFRRSEDEKQMIQESLKREWEASSAAHFSIGYPAKEFLASKMKYDLDITKSKFADSVIAFGIKKPEPSYRSPKEALSAIEADVGLRVKGMTTEELALIYSPLKDLRDARGYPLGSMENIYQEVRREYLNRDN